MDQIAYETSKAQAATDQGLDPIAAELEAAQFDFEILNTGGWCMALVVPVFGGHVVVTAFDNEDGEAMVGAYAGGGWEDGAMPIASAENVATADVLATVERFADALIDGAL